MNLNTETRYVIFYVNIYCSCMEEPQILLISFTISEYIVMQFIHLKLLNKTII
jgi:hypothetical protein